MLNDSCRESARIARIACAVVALLLIAGCNVDDRKKDTTPPELTIPDDMFVYATGPNGATVSWPATAVDDFVTGAVPVTCTPVSGSQFPIGDTTVTCTTSDAVRNTTSRTFKITVSDTDVTPPVLTVPTNLTLSTSNAAGTQVSWTTPSAMDDRDGTVPATCSPEPGMFSVGVTTVTCTARDAGGNTATRTFQVTVNLTLNTILQMDAGNLFSCAVISDHTARCWGDANSGKIGNGKAYDANGNAVHVLTPDVVVDNTGAPLSGVQSVSAGEDFACAVMGDGTARCWGRHSEAIGIGTSSTGVDFYKDKAQIVMTAEGTPLRGVVSIDAGAAHACAVLEDHTARCWGRNSWVNGIQGYGQLGDGTDRNSAFPVAVIDPDTGVELDNVAAISAGYQHTCAVLRDGTARCWGRDNGGQLGDGPAVLDYAWVKVMDPQTNAPLAGITAIQAGIFSTCAVLSDGTARCWGRGSLGTGTPLQSSSNIEQSDFPLPVLDPTTGAAMTGVLSLDTWGFDNGLGRACALRNDHTLRCWGAEPGDGSSFSQPPLAVPGIGDAVAVVTGAAHSCVIVDGGSGARCWGHGEAGTLGNGTTVNTLVPVPVTGLP